MNAEDDLINRIESLKRSKWAINNELDIRLKELEDKLNALRSMRKK